MIISRLASKNRLLLMGLCFLGVQAYANSEFCPLKPSGSHTKPGVVPKIYVKAQNCNCWRVRYQANVVRKGHVILKPGTKKLEAPEKWSTFIAESKQACTTQDTPVSSEVADGLLNLNSPLANGLSAGGCKAKLISGSASEPPCVYEVDPE